MQSILVVDDDPEIREVVAAVLGASGYRVCAAASGADGLRHIAGSRPALLLLDVVMPGMTGLEVCRTLRGGDETRDMPIIVLSARKDEADIVRGLENGADDYLTKPFKPAELLARVRAVLRRASAARASAPTLPHGRLAVDAERLTAALDDRVVPLTRTEFRILELLARRPGRPYTRSQLLEHACAAGADAFDRTIDVHIRAIREKLGSARELIETVRGVGYRLAEDR